MAANKSPRTRVRWWILWLGFGLGFVAYALRMNFSILADVLMPEFEISEVQMGWVFGAFTAGYAIFQLPGGLLSERIGARLILAVMAALWGVVTLLTGILPGILVASTAGVLATLIVVRFALGVVNAPIFPVQSGVIQTWFPIASWALPNSLINMGLGLGAAATPPAMVWLTSALGWRMTLFVTAPLGLIGALWWWYARDDPRDHPKIDAQELELINAGRGEPDAHALTAHALKRMFADRNVQLLTLAYFFHGYVFYIFFNWFFLYLVNERGFVSLTGGFLASLPWIAGALVAPIGGQLCDVLCQRLGPRLGCRIPCVVAMPLMGAFLMAGAMAPSPAWAVGLLTVSFGLNLFSDGAYWAGMTFVARRHTPAGCGIMNTAANLGGFVSAPLMPFLAEWFGWQAALGSGAVVSVLGAVLWMFIRVDQPLETNVDEIPRNQWRRDNGAAR